MSYLGKFIAGFLVVFAAVSLVVDAVLVFEVWHLRQSLVAQLATSVSLANHTLSTSNQALTILDNQIQTLGTLTTTSGNAAQSTVQTIDATHQSLQSASHLLRTDLPATLATVHAAVVSAQSAAAVVDGVLGTLSLIPGLPAAYKPPVPLHVALGNVAQSLDTLPGLTSQLANDLDAANAQLPATRSDVANVASTLQQAPVDTTQMRSVVSQYQVEVSQLQSEIQGLQATAAQAMTWIAIAVTFLICWLAIAQAAILAAGIHWLRGNHVLVPLERSRPIGRPVPFRAPRARGTFDGPAANDPAL